jgi:hypothetical protein
MIGACTVVDEAPSPSFPVEHRYGEGVPAELTLRLSDTRITTAEQLSLVVTTRYPEEWTATLPKLGERLGDFRVVEQFPGRSRLLLPERRLETSRRYVLEPALEGTYTIPALRVGFREHTGDAERAAYVLSISSESIAVSVRSVLPPVVGRAEIEEIDGPVSVGPQWPYWLAGGSAGVAAALVLVFLVLRRWPRRVRQAAVVVQDPGDLARSQLEALVSEELIAAGRVDEFYTRISGIVRRYIEGRFDVRAPEQTTEEFLLAAGKSEPLAPHKDALSGFLHEADLVKFAQYRPGDQAADDAVLACRAFLDATEGEAAP